MSDLRAFVIRSAAALMFAYAAFHTLVDGLNDGYPEICIFGAAVAILAINYACGAKSALTTPRPTAEHKLSAEVSRLLMLHSATTHFSFAVLFGCLAFYQIIRSGQVLVGAFSLVMAVMYIWGGREELRKSRHRAAARPLGPPIEQLP